MRLLIDDALLLDETKYNFIGIESLLGTPGSDSGLFKTGTGLEGPVKGKYTWILDNGHGGMIEGVYQTAGKRSPPLEDGSIVYEGVFNRIIVRKIIEKCRLYGFNCINLVDSEKDLSLSSRVRTANELHRKHKNCIYISVHANASEDGKMLEGNFFDAHGIETYYFQNPKNSKVYSKEGRRVAELFHKNIIKNTARRDRGPKGDNYYVLRNTIMPSIITENGFMTHKEEARLLLNEDYQNKVAQGHFDAILEMEFMSVLL